MKCKHCGREVEVMQRITGYLRPKSNFNEGKKQEFIERGQCRKSLEK